MIRLFIIEDHLTLIISGLRFLFRPERDGISVTGYAITVEEAIGKADPELFDLFILDLYIPGHQPIDNIRKLKTHFPGKPVAIYTSESSSSWKKKMMEEGALTYITKDSSRDELKTAIQKAAKGELFYFFPLVPTEQKKTGSEQSSVPHELSPVQNNIVKLLSEGHSHSEISDRTGISRSLIEKILKNLRTSFKVKNNLELIKCLLQNGSI
jgi:two-component system nitrate/nitrite response regulator NarL